MAIYRTLYYTDVSIGVGGRITIPQGLRNDLRLAAKDSLRRARGGMIMGPCRR